MNRIGPYLLVLAGLALASSDTLRVGIARDTAPEGWVSVLGVIVTSLGYIWSHRSISRRLPTADQAIDVDALAHAAADALLEQLRAPGASLAAVVSEAAGAAARQAGDLVVRQVRAELAAAAHEGPAGRGVPFPDRRRSLEEIAAPPAGLPQASASPQEP